MIRAQIITDSVTGRRERHVLSHRGRTTPASVLHRAGFAPEGSPRALATDRPERWVAIHDGKRVDLDHELRVDDDIVLARMPSGFVGFVLFAVLNAAIGVGIGLLINALIGPPGVPQVGGGPEGSNTYGFGGITNTRTAGTKIPTLHGTHRVGGQVLTLYRANESASSTTQFLYMLIGHCRGQVTELNGLGDDADGLTTGGSFIEPFVTSGAVDAYANWELVDGTAGRLIRAGTEQLGVSASSGASLVRWLDSFGLTATNYDISIDVDAFAGTKTVALAGNAQDLTNFIRLEVTQSNRWDLVQTVAGTPTTLGFQIGTLTGKKLTLRRSGSTLTVLVDDVDQGSFTADASLTSANVGLWAAASGSAGSLFDNFTVESAANLSGDLHINGNPATVYNNITAWQRIGRATNAPLPAGSGFAQVIQGYEIDTPISTSWTVYDFTEESDGFHIVVEFPNGLFDQSGGGLNDKSVTIDVEYRASSSGAWQQISGAPFTFTHALTSPFSRTIFLTDGSLSGSGQQIRVRRTEPEASDDALVIDAVRIGAVNEILRDTSVTYDGIAFTALRIEAQANLQGGTPLVTSLIKGPAVPTWDGVSGGSAAPEIVYQFSNNNAWCALDLLLDKADGLGNFVTLADIDMDELYAWASWCDDVLQYREAFDEPLLQLDDTEPVSAGSMLVIVDNDRGDEFSLGEYVRVELERVNQIVASPVDLGGGRWRLELAFPVIGTYPANWTLSKVEIGDDVSDVRATFDGVHDAEVGAWDALLRICRAGRALPVKEGSKFRFRFEDERPVDQVITDANIVRGSLEITYLPTSDRVDFYEAQYLDSSVNYDQEVAVGAGLPVEDVTREPRSAGTTIYGVVRGRHARREANFLLRVNKLLSKRARFKVTLDSIAVQSGDVVRLGLTLPGDAYWSGRVHGTTAAIKPDTPIALPSGAASVYVRNGSDRAGTRYNVTNPSGAQIGLNDLLTTDASPAVELVSDATALVEASASTSSLWRVTKVRLAEDLTAEVECVEYNPDVYVNPGFPSGEGVQPAPAPGGCVSTGGVYTINLGEDGLDAFCPVEQCPVGTGLCCFVGSVNVQIVGDAAPAVTIIELAGDILVINVGPGHEGDEFCVRVTSNGNWVRVDPGCPFESCSQAIPNCTGISAPPCNQVLDFCWDVCGAAFSNAFDDDEFDAQAP